MLENRTAEGSLEMDMVIAYVEDKKRQSMNRRVIKTTSREVKKVKIWPPLEAIY